MALWVVMAIPGGEMPPSSAATRNARPPRLSPTTETARRSVHDGDTVIVTGGVWACGSSPAALDEIAKWLVRGDNQEAALATVRTGSSLVETGDVVKVLDLGLMHTKVRVQKNSRECWVASELARSGQRH